MDLFWTTDQPDNNFFNTQGSSRRLISSLLNRTHLTPSLDILSSHFVAECPTQYIVELNKHSYSWRAPGRYPHKIDLVTSQAATSVARSFG